MKIRDGFVSNSSSSSFMIRKSNLTTLQVVLIHEHIVMGERLGIDGAGDEYNAWMINEDTGKISGHCIMDNFDMPAYLEEIGVDLNVVHWD